MFPCSPVHKTRWCSLSLTLPLVHAHTRHERSTFHLVSDGRPATLLFLSNSWLFIYALVRPPLAGHVMLTSVEGHLAIRPALLSGDKCLSLGIVLSVIAVPNFSLPHLNLYYQCE